MDEGRRRRIAWITAGVLSVLLVANSGFRSLTKAFFERQRLKRSITRLRADNARLSVEAARIKEDPSYTEYLIRKNLGYIKKGEVEYRFVPKKDGGKP